MNKKHCSGCYQDRYNHKGMCERPGIDAVVTSDECWHLETAKLVWRKQVSISQIPPWKQKAIRVPDCYTMSGYVFVEKNKGRAKMDSEKFYALSWNDANKAMKKMQEHELQNLIAFAHGYIEQHKKGGC